MNKVILLGYLSRDPELREFPEKDLKIAKVNIAVSDERNFSKSYFFNCSAFNKTADYIMSNLKKGDFVSIDGNLTNNSYVNGEGKKVQYTEIVIQSIRNLGRRAKTSDSQMVGSIGSDDESVSINDYITSDSNLIKSNINLDDNFDDSSQDGDDEINWDDE